MSLQYSGYVQSYFWDEKPFVPKIYSAEVFENIPEGFNVVSLKLDASGSSSLDWKKSIEAARSYIEKGYLIFWNIDSGLIQQFSTPISDEGQFQTIAFSLKHFSKEIWPEFEIHTFGALLFDGDFSSLHWGWGNEEEWEKWKAENPFCHREQFLRDVILDYLKLLCVELPEALNTFVMLDTDFIESIDDYFQFTRLDAYDHFRLILKGKWPTLFPFAVPSLGGFHGFSPLGYFSRETFTNFGQKKIPLGICLPKRDPQFNIDSVLEKLSKSDNGNLPIFRIIPEQMLTYEWDGIDDLIVFSEALTLQGKRKLRGFCAAGGRVVTIGDKIGVSEEVPFEDLYFETYRVSR